MSQSVLQHQAVAQMSISIAEIQEFLNAFLKNKEGKEVAAKILFKHIKDFRLKSEIEIVPEHYPGIENIFKTFDVTGKEEIIKLKTNVFIAFEQLKYAMIKSVSGISNESRALLLKELNALSYANRYLNNPDNPAQLRWFKRCMNRVDIVYSQCIAEDRSMVNKALIEEISYLIKYIASIVRRVAFIETTHDRLAEKKFMESLDTTQIANTEETNE